MSEVSEALVCRGLLLRLTPPKRLTPQKSSNSASGASSGSGTAAGLRLGRVCARQDEGCVTWALWLKKVRLAEHSGPHASPQRGAGQQHPRTFVSPQPAPQTRSTRTGGRFGACNEVKQVSATASHLTPQHRDSKYCSTHQWKGVSCTPSCGATNAAVTTRGRVALLWRRTTATGDRLAAQRRGAARCNWTAVRVWTRAVKVTMAPAKGSACAAGGQRGRCWRRRFGTLRHACAAHHRGALACVHPAQSTCRHNALTPVACPRFSACSGTAQQARPVTSRRSPVALAVRCQQNDIPSVAAQLSRRALVTLPAVGAVLGLAVSAAPRPAFAAPTVDWAAVKADLVAVIADPTFPGGIGERGPTLVRTCRTSGAWL